jgi:hypothetical protein
MNNKTTKKKKRKERRVFKFIYLKDMKNALRGLGHLFGKWIKLELIAYVCK